MEQHELVKYILDNFIGDNYQKKVDELIHSEGLQENKLEENEEEEEEEEEMPEE